MVKENSELLDKIKTLMVGEKITLLVENYFGNIVKVRVTYLGDLRPNGFIDRSGGWGLYDTHKLDEIPCYSINARIYKKRYISVFKLDFEIKDFEIGW